jgi:CheY-like chemotaxis protein
MKILVVDDDPAILRLFKRVLTTQGYEVITAQNATEGFELACQAQPEILITDFDMPGENGLELIMKLQRSGPKTSQIQCLLMSGCEKAYIQQICRASRPDLLSRLLFKPFNLNELLDNIWKTAPAREVNSLAQPL